MLETTQTRRLWTWVKVRSSEFKSDRDRPENQACPFRSLPCRATVYPMKSRAVCDRLIVELKESGVGPEALSAKYCGKAKPSVKRGPVYVHWGTNDWETPRHGRQSHDTGDSALSSQANDSACTQGLCGSPPGRNAPSLGGKTARPPFSVWINLLFLPKQAQEVRTDGTRAAAPPKWPGGRVGTLISAAGILTTREAAGDRARRRR